MERIEDNTSIIRNFMNGDGIEDFANLQWPYHVIVKVISKNHNSTNKNKKEIL